MSSIDMHACRMWSTDVTPYMARSRMWSIALTAHMGQSQISAVWYKAPTTYMEHSLSIL